MNAFDGEVDDEFVMQNDCCGNACCENCYNGILNKETCSCCRSILQVGYHNWSQTIARRERERIRSQIYEEFSRANLSSDSVEHQSQTLKGFIRTIVENGTYVLSRVWEGITNNISMTHIALGLSIASFAISMINLQTNIRINTYIKKGDKINKNVNEIIKIVGEKINFVSKKRWWEKL